MRKIEEFYLSVCVADLNNIPFLIIVTDPANDVSTLRVEP